jgi:hypothetical protein
MLNRAVGFDLNFLLAQHEDSIRSTEGISDGLDHYLNPCRGEESEGSILRHVSIVGLQLAPILASLT